MDEGASNSGNVNSSEIENLFWLQMITGRLEERNILQKGMQVKFIFFLNSSSVGKS